MPIYYQKIPQNEENESMNYNNSGHPPKANFLRQSRANSYYELSEFDSSGSILSIDQIYLEENVQLERIETRYGSVVVGKQIYANGRPTANGDQKAGQTTATGHPTNGSGPTAVHSALNGSNNSIPNGVNNGLNAGRKSGETKSSDANSVETKPAEATAKEAKRAKLNSIILTVHDIGLNHESNFLQFFNNLNAKILLKNFTVYHLNLPGQHTSSEQIAPIYAYPTMDQMSEIIDFVVGYYEIGECLSDFGSQIFSLLFGL